MKKIQFLLNIFLILLFYLCKYLMLMMKNIINIHNVRNGKIVDEESIASSVVTGKLNLNEIKKEVKKIYKERHNKFITGALIRINKDDTYSYYNNEYYIYYDGKNFKRKFNLFWDLKEANEFLGTSRFEPVIALKDM